MKKRTKAGSSFLLLWMMFAPRPATAAVATPGWMNLLEQTEVRLKKIKPSATAIEFNKSTLRESACYQTYESFYQDSPIDIRIVFGYKDARPARFVGDRYERIALIQHLTHPCTPGYEACGFVRDIDDADLLAKRIAGPDGTIRQIRLRVTHSSAGPDDDENRHSTLQSAQSHRSTQNFLSGLQSADVVFYNGHSRDGGGPDFTPPRIRQSDLHVNYPWYRKHKPGMKQMVAALKNGIKRPRVIGLFSCVSSRHFSTELKKSSPGTSLVTNDQLLYYTDALENSLGALNALLGMWCEPAFKRAIQAQPGKPSRLSGFFTVSQ